MVNFALFIPFSYFWCFAGHKCVDVLKHVAVSKTIVWCKNNFFRTIIFQCSKIYHKPTRATRLRVYSEKGMQNTKFAPNMAIPISPNEKGFYTSRNHIFGLCCILYYAASNRLLLIQKLHEHKIVRPISVHCSLSLCGLVTYVSGP